MPVPSRPTRTGRAARWLVPCLTAALLAPPLAGCAGGAKGPSAGASPARSTAASERQVPLTVVRQAGETMAFVPVTIQGRGPFSFVLDTGASTSAVDDAVARQLRLPTSGRRRPISGVAGTESVPVVKLTSWKAGAVALGPVDASAISMQSSPGSPRIQGLLGSDVLSRFGHITVDYADRVLRLPAG